MLKHIPELANEAELRSYIGTDHPPRELSYFAFAVLRRDGTRRLIQSPSPKLKAIQDKLARLLSRAYDPPRNVHGFVPGRNVQTNALEHSGRRHILNIDIRDFFGSITRVRLADRLSHNPYRLPEDICNVLLPLVTHHGVLPQGAPTSPVLSNIYCEQLDARLAAECRRNSAFYSRYADDITISSNEPIFPTAIAVRYGRGIGDVVVSPTLSALLRSFGFELNHQKTRLQSSPQRQEVTGVTVGQRMNPRPAVIRRAEAFVHMVNKFGMNKCEEFNSKRFPMQPHGSFRAKALGTVAYLGMIRGRGDLLYRQMLAALGDKEPPRESELEYWDAQLRQTSVEFLAGDRKARAINAGDGRLLAAPVAEPKLTSREASGAPAKAIRLARRMEPIHGERVFTLASRGSGDPTTIETRVEYDDPFGISPARVVTETLNMPHSFLVLDFTGSILGSYCPIDRILSSEVIELSQYTAN